MSEKTSTEFPLEVRIFTDFKTELIKTISWNYEELEANIRKTLEPFTNLVLDKTSESIKFAKGKRAEINKLAKVITDARIETKKRFLAPYEEFEARCNALIKICQSSSGQFDEFVKECEAEIKQTKLRVTHAYFLKRLGEVFADDEASRNSPYWAEFEKSNPKWNNLTYAEKDIISDMEAALTKAKEAVDTISALFASHAPDILEKAKIEIRKNFDIVRTSTVVNGYIAEQAEIKRRTEERLAREAAEKLAREEAEQRAKAALEEKRKELEAAKAAETTAPAPVAAQTQTEPPTVAPAPTPTVNTPEEVMLDFDIQFNCPPTTIANIISKAVNCGISCNSAVLHLSGTRSMFGAFSDAIASEKADGLSYRKCLSVVCAD